MNVYDLVMDAVTGLLEGVRARDGSAYGYMSKFTFPDKTSFEVVPDKDVTASGK